MPEDLPTALAEIRSLLLDRDGLVRGVAAGRRRGNPPRWRRVELRPVTVKSGPVLQVTTYDATQAHTDNHDWARAAATVDALLSEPFGNWHVETRDATVQLRVTKKGQAQVHRAGAPAHPAATDRHDRSKQRMVEPTEPFLSELGITTADGAVKASRADKYRQVEEFVRALDPVVRSALADGRLEQRRLEVVDLGCGNAYLTFAAYRHLSHRLGLDVRLTGVDVKAQARRHNEEVAARLGWGDRVRFVEGTIGGTDVAGADIVMALHACDTATDDALARAVAWRAPVVLAAPCCQHDLQLRLRGAGRTPDAVAGVMRHGILRERLGDLLTDAFRAEILRSRGYRVEVLEFVDTRHTPRNVLLRAELTATAPVTDRDEQLRAMTDAWGVTPRLAELLHAEGN